MQWESVMHAEVAQNHQGKTYFNDVVGSLHYDYKIGVAAVLQEVYTENVLTATFTYIMNQNATYIVDTGKLNCIKMPKTSIAPVCTDIPGLAYRGSWILGNQMTDTYSIKTLGVSLTYITMFRDPFIPGIQNTQQSVEGVDQMSTLQVANVTEGIKDAGVFEVPGYCDSNMPVTESSMHSQFLRGLLIGMK
ncbi:uncharacterized protein [Watersipora subatra]|uniref:uncharacterized protein n=1 Tax=Watersipora subatra TaxID=2589382 RepID=UPI00355C87D0